MPLNHTLRFTRRNLPHWEVLNGSYFITVRCADSLPADSTARLAEILKTLATIEPRSEQFAAVQRRYFATLEKYLHAGVGTCPLLHPNCAQSVVDELNALNELGVHADHFTIMPNHWHALLAFPEDRPAALSAVMKRIKGRTGLRINRELGQSGPLWQREWFDRWIRNATEWDRCVDYIHENPVKAGLATAWSEHPFTK